MSETTTCHRCKRAVPDLLPHDWEVIEDEDGQPREVCGDCITPSEQQAIGEETIDFAEEMRGHDRSTSHRLRWTTSS